MQLALHVCSDPLIFWSSILVLQYLILREFLEKKIASFITLSVSLYSKQMLHRKVILTWPWAIITNTWCNNFSFISFYGRFFLFLEQFSFSKSLVTARLLLWTVHCSVLWVWFPLRSWKGWLMQTSVSFFWICKCLFDGSLQRTHPGWVLVLDLPCLFLPSDRCFSLCFSSSSSPPLIPLWSVKFGAAGCVLW